MGEECCYHQRQRSRMGCSDVFPCPFRRNVELIFFKEYHSRTTPLLDRIQIHYHKQIHLHSNRDICIEKYILNPFMDQFDDVTP